MKVTILLLGLLAFCEANPFAKEEWARISPIPKVAPKSGVHSNLTPEYDDSKIVGGVDATPNEFPWQVGLYLTKNDGTYFCGGSIISPDWILTAAHCTEGCFFVTVVMGAQNINQFEGTQVRMDSTDIITHENYNGAVGLEFDIGLIRLPSPVGFTNAINQIYLPSYSHYMGGGNWLTTSGWGQTSSGSGPDNLQKVTVQTYSDADCGAIINNYGGTVLCTSSAGGIGVCFGDSGGPLTYVEGERTYHEGVTSFVVGDCGSGWPNGFTRTTTYLSWISGRTGIPIDP